MRSVQEQTKNKGKRVKFLIPIKVNTTTTTISSSNYSSAPSHSFHWQRNSFRLSEAISVTILLLKTIISLPSSSAVVTNVAHTNQLTRTDCFIRKEGEREEFVLKYLYKKRSALMRFMFCSILFFFLSLLHRVIDKKFSSIPFINWCGEKLSRDFYNFR